MFEGEVMEKNLSKKEKIKVVEPPSADLKFAVSS
jgi:hypothetical protein